METEGAGRRDEEDPCQAPNKWYRDPVVWIELFVIVNLGFLSLDIYLAHSINQFHHEAEYIPFWFSIAARPSCSAALCWANAAA